MAKSDMVVVRIPKALFDELNQTINEIPVSEANGTTRRVNESFGLTDSNAAIVNTSLLALLSGVKAQSRIALLTQLTPGVNMTYVNEAKKRMIPNNTVNVSVNDIADLQKNQDEWFQALANGMENLYSAQEQAGTQSLKDNGSMLQLLAYWIGATSQANVTNTAIYDDTIAQAVKKAIQPYGDQHARDVRSKQRKQESDPA